MGCDIHGWVEKKVGLKWVAYKELQDRERNYERFGALAGVRRDGPQPKGIPDDISDTAGLWVQEGGSDCHSHSYLPLQEAFEIFLRTRHVFSNSAEHYGLWTAFGIDDWELNGEFRLVFWFDN